MKRILDFCQRHKYAIIWTACYAVVMWSILFWLFNFNMFSATQWRILAHAELRGFPGFVFGILILAAVPMYIATTSIVIRTKKPLFKIPLPKFMTPVPIDAPTTAPAPPPCAHPHRHGRPTPRTGYHAQHARKNYPGRGSRSIHPCPRTWRHFSEICI